MAQRQLLIGIDAGGSKTVALLAAASGRREPEVLGRGLSGPANPLVLGLGPACKALDEAVQTAFGAAGMAVQPAAAACLAVAGSAREPQRQGLARWAQRRRLADRLAQAHDAEPVLAAGTPDGWGVAAIAGTGSLAFGRHRQGRSARAGGWGYLIGDEGSGYWLAISGLRAVLRAADGLGPQTTLQPRLLRRLNVAEPQELIAALHGPETGRAAIAGLADVVTAAADEGDRVAAAILDDAAAGLAALVRAVADRLGLASEPFPLALAGGVLLAPGGGVGQRLVTRLKAMGLQPQPVTPVAEPARGALMLAAAMLASGRQ